MRRVMVAAATAEQLIVSRNRTGLPIPSAPKQTALLPASSPLNPKKAREERRALVAAAAAPKDLAASRARLAARAAQGARERQRQREQRQREQRLRGQQQQLARCHSCDFAPCGRVTTSCPLPLLQQLWCNSAATASAAA